MTIPALLKRLDENRVRQRSRFKRDLEAGWGEFYNGFP